MHNFYLICPINFEKSVLKELELKNLTGRVNIIEVAKGGIELECELETGFYLNKILKTPTRILMRIHTQKCRDFPKLYNIIKKINWKDYLVNYTPQIKVSTSKSRILHSDKAKDTITDAIGFYFNANKIGTKVLEQYKEQDPQKIFIRIHEDNLTISIDTSGDPLYMRGDRSDRGHASIRENYACCLLLECLPKDHESKILLDPMCGTGTFLYEAAHFYDVNDHRDYIFNCWPLLKAKIIPLIEIPSSDLFKSYQGNDIDEDLIERNRSQVGIEFTSGDFFKTDFPKEAFIISNLPYGKRVKIEGNTHQFFQSVLDKLKDYKGALLMPESANIKKKPMISFNNNGILVKLVSL